MKTHAAGIRNMIKLEPWMIGVVSLALSFGCMRIAPDHPYDPESPPSYRAPASLISAIYHPELPDDFDYGVFMVTLTSAEEETVHTRRAESSGRFRFDGIPPGEYIISVRGSVEGSAYGILGEEVFLPVGEVLNKDLFFLYELLE